MSRRTTDRDEADDLVARIEAAEMAMQRTAIKSGVLGIFFSDLTMQQVRVLLVLAAAGDQSAHELAEALGVGPTTLTGIVDRLEARGMVHRVPDPTDRRVRRIDLADEGRQLLRDLQQIKREHQRRTLARLGRSDLRKLAEAMEALQVAASDEFDQR